MPNKSSTIKVLALVRPDKDVSFGGDLVQIEQTIRHLQKYRVDVEVKELASTWSASEYDIVHFFHLPMIEYWAVRETHKHQRPVVISPIFWDTTASWFAESVVSSVKWRVVSHLLGKNWSGKAYVWWQHIKRPFGQKWKEQRLILESADFVLPNSRMELMHLANYFLLSVNSLAPRTLVVPNGVDTSLFANSPSAREEFYAKYGLCDFVLEVARIELVKGQLELIKALRDVPVPLVFIGRDSPYEPKYALKCREAGHARGNTFFLGYIPHHELPSAYAASLVHVLPSWRETPGLSTLEAAAMGCKVVSTSIGSAREYLGDMAWYCRPDDVNSIRQSVVQALQAPPSDELRKHVLKNFTWEKAAELTHKAYVQVLNHN